MKKKLIVISLLTCVFSMQSQAQNTEQDKTDLEISKFNPQSLLKQFNEFEEKQKIFYHPSLLTYEEDFVAQGEKKLEYFLEVSKDNKVIYDGKFDLQNSKPITVFTGMSQNEKDGTEVIKKAIEVDGEGQKAFESKKLNSFELSLILHMKKNSDNLYSQFFIEQQDKDFSKEVVVAKSGAKVMGSQSSKGPENIKDKDEFIIQHQYDSKTTMTWKDYTFKILAQKK